jgi:hypothetical protein
MSLFIVDIESDGPIPVDYSMVCFGAIIVDEALDKTYYGQTRPISDKFVPEALAISGFTREQHFTFPEPEDTMFDFRAWIEKNNTKGRPIFASDNLAFDWQFTNYYMHKFTGGNIFGFSGRRIGDVYAGMVKDFRKASEWKKYRVTRHSHNPVDDARGNAEALLKFRELGLKL